MTSPLPRHIAVVMDGNGRWAKSRLLPRAAGHKAGVKQVKKLVVACGEKGIAALSLFAFSRENWSRPAGEVSALMQLFLDALQREIDELHEKRVQIRFIGDLSQLSPVLQQACEAAWQRTQHNSGLKLRVAVNYGGQWDIVRAAQKLAQQVQAGQLSIADINDVAFAAQLSTADLPPVDLFIRTSGEQRLSNFLLWQAAYAELYFSEVAFPAFDQQEFDKALQWFSVRERRFGKTSEQLRG